MPSSKKKTRKKQYQPRPASTRPVVPAGTASPAAPTMAAPRTGDSKAPAVGDEYRYVISDLKRIGITAAAMFAILVILALVIT